MWGGCSLGGWGDQGSFWTRAPQVTQALIRPRRSSTDLASNKSGASLWLGDLGDRHRAGEGPGRPVPFADGPTGPA